MQTYVEAMQPGWNLGNTLDATPNETAWGNPLTTQALIQQFKAQGFKSIRIPVTWDTGNRIGPAPSYTIDPAWLNRVQQIVDWSLDAGFYVMLNMHHDSVWLRSMPANHDAVLAKFNAIWSQIAPRFRDHSNKLMLESINEPDFDGASDATKMSLLRELNTSFVNTVRGTGGGNATRPLVLPSVVTNAGQPYLDSLKATMTALNDPNLIATIHFYGYWPFAVNIAGGIRFDAPVIDDIRTSLDNVSNTFVSAGIPVVLGEFGLLGFGGYGSAVERGEVLKYFEYLTSYTRSKGVTYQWWDAGDFFNRSTYQWRDPELYDYIMRSLVGRSSTAASDLIFVKTDAPADTAIALNLNGNTFVSLTNGATTLTPGVDYTISGSVLTVKAGMLAPDASGAFGERAVLHANFSAGLPWKLRVRHQVTAVFSAKSGNKGDGLVIPAAFNGDLVATMEAKYVASPGYPYPGQAEWTSFKQYNEAYVPDYANNAITVKKEFFAATNSSPVELTFHFWSGRIAKYQLAFSGADAVTGKPVLVPPDYAWAPFTVGAAGSWTPPTGLGANATFTATGLPAWASLNPATGEINGTPTGSASAITQATFTIAAPEHVSGTMRVNVVVASPGADVAPVNLSTRGRVGIGDQVLIPGFVVGGSSPRTFLIRAVGPTLATSPFNVTGTLADPELTVFDGNGAELFFNDNWGTNANADAVRSAFAATGAFALGDGSKDAALLVTLQPGLYTAKASGVGGTTGVALVELYDATSSGVDASTLLNISTRALVGAGDEVLIPGIVLRGGGTKRLLVRAVGPGLASFGVTGFLSDPQIAVMQDQDALAANDDWCIGNDADEIRAVAASVGAFDLPVSSRDAVLLTAIPERAYTIVVRGGGGSTGIALVEVYVVP